MTVGKLPAQVAVLHCGLVQGTRQYIDVGLEPGDLLRVGGS
ncbi:hypothetical protein ACFXPY_44840 [Streptomyces sp. NPDC059153]